MHIFYTPQISADETHFTLSEEESKHCVRVLRLSIGSNVQLVDGRGGVFEAQVVDDHPKRTHLRIDSFTATKKIRDYHLHLMVAPTKNIERFEWFLEKSTEIGIDAITPILCDHSERKEIKWDRLNKIIVAAMKQSQQYYLPQLNEILAFDEVVIANYSAKKFIAHCEDGQKQFLSECLNQKEDLIILIGPEGDFSSQEIEQATSASFTPISLGSTRLRTETAATVAVLEASLINRYNS